MSSYSQWEILDIKRAGKSNPYWVESEEEEMSQQKKIRNDQTTELFDEDIRTPFTSTFNRTENLKKKKKSWKEKCKIQIRTKQEFQGWKI